MIRWRGMLLLAAAWPFAAPAQEVDYGSIDGFLVPHARARWPDSFAASGVEGYGLGARVLSRATDQLVVLGEFQYLTYDDPETGTGQYRIGAGWALPTTSTGLYLTYDHLDLDAENAFALGLHARVAGEVQEPLSLYASAGYLATDGASFYLDGFEFTLGATLDLPEPWGMFADYRATLLDSRDSDDRLHWRQWRAGVRFRFNC